MSNKMKIGFIGCGGFAQGNHIPNVAKNPNMSIRAFCDLDTGVLERLQSKYASDYVTTNIRKIFADDKIEMVVCATKPDFRLPVMQMAVESGKALFVEKPLCYQDDEIQPMVKLINNSNIKFMVGFNRPYSPMMQDIKPLFKNNKKEGNTTIIYRIVGEARLWPFHHYDAVVNRKESTIIHEATHIFDLLNWLTDSFPFRIYTAGGGNMDNVITLEYPDNTTAVIVSADNSTAGIPKERLEINSDFGTIIGDNFVETRALGFENQDFFNKTYDCMIEGKKYNIDGEESGVRHRLWRQSLTTQQIEKGYYYTTQVKVDKGHYNELEFFRNAIIKDLSIETGIINGAVANIIAWKAIESWKKHMPIDLNFSKLQEL
jgi:predicted dehydrogenase